MDDLVQVALLAYRHGRYSDAVELLLTVVDADPNNWLAKLYLATAYGKDGRLTDSQRLFKRMTIDCPEPSLRIKAEDGLRIIEQQMKEAFRRPARERAEEPVAASRVVNWW